MWSLFLLSEYKHDSNIIKNLRMVPAGKTSLWPEVSIIPRITPTYNELDGIVTVKANRPFMN